MDPILLAFIQFLLLLSGVAALVITFVILLLALIEGAGAMGAREWASTTGLIVASYVATAKDDDDPKGVKMFYLPSVSYTYFVNGMQQMGERLYFGSTRQRERAAAEKKLEKYPAGAAVTVYFDPAMPNKAALECRAPHATFLMWIALGVLALCVVSFALAFLLPGWVI